MKILLAVDGSECTRKAVAFVVTHEAMLEGGELVVVHVQPPLPPRVEGFVGHQTVAQYHEDEARKVLAPVEEFIARHRITFRSRWVVGRPAHEIARLAAEEHANFIVMGTHGHGVLGRALLGSVAQGVLVHAEMPVLLVK